MIRRRPSPLFAAALIVLLSPAAARTLPREEIVKNFEKTVALAAGQRLTIDHKNGNVRVKTHRAAEVKIAALDDAGSNLFTPRERAALTFADLMATDHHKVDDAMFAELRRHFSEAEIVELGVSTALFIGFGRLNAVIGIDPV